MRPTTTTTAFPGDRRRLGDLAIPFTEPEAGGRFGKGRHPARLNHGDCFSYALAKTTGARLLFNGDDLSRTDFLAAT